MAYYNAPMTKLDAVNLCLSSMGEPQISTLSGDVLDAQIASDLIDETSRSVQSRGWHWNLEKYKLSPNQAGQISLPPNTARVDSIKNSEFDVVQRGTRLFNRTDNTYQFTTTVEVELYVLLPFEELTLSAKNYIALRSARILQQRLLGSEVLFKFNQIDENQAWIVLLQEEADVGDYNVLYDNNSTGSMLMRNNY